jgi:predicted MFS family arabinose efflux permease
MPALVLSCLTPLIAAVVVAIGIDEPDRSGPQAEPDYFATMLEGFREIRSSTLLLTTLICLSVVIAVNGTLDEYIGPLLNERAMSIGDIGIVYAIALCARIIGSACAHRVQLERPLLSFMGVCAILLLVPFLTGYWLALLLACFFGVCALVEVMFQARLQRQIEGSARATVTSVVGMGEELFALGMFFSIGLVAQGYGWTVAFCFTAVLGMLASVFLMRQ